MDTTLDTAELAELAAFCDEETLARLHAEKSFHEFVKQAWHVVEPGTPFVGNWHIQAICDHLEAVVDGRIPKILINIPPGTMKSLLTAVFLPAWVWLRKADARFLYASYAEELSIRDSVKCRDLVQSDWYRDRWGDRVTLKIDQNQKLKFDTAAGGWRIATSVGGRGTGEHPDFIIADDPHKASEAESEVNRQTVTNWWDRTMGSRGVSRGARRIVVMQRLHEGDLAGHLLAQGGYVHLCLPMEFEPDRKCKTILGWEDPRTQEGELLWKDLFPRTVVDDLKVRLGPYGVAGQLQQRPAPAEGAMFRRSDFRYFREEEMLVRRLSGQEELVKVFVLTDDGGKERKILEANCAWFQTIDTNLKITETSAYTIVMTLILTNENDLLVYDVFRERMEVIDQYDMLMSQREKHPRVLFQGLEETSGSTGLLQQARSEGRPFLPLDPWGKKEERAFNAALMTKGHKVFFRQNGTWLEGFENRLILFPLGKYKDEADCLAYGAQLAIEDKMLRAAVEGDLVMSASGDTNWNSNGQKTVEIAGVKIAVDDDNPKPWWDR